MSVHPPACCVFSFTSVLRSASAYTCKGSRLLSNAARQRQCQQGKKGHLPVKWKVWHMIRLAANETHARVCIACKGLHCLLDKLSHLYCLQNRLSKRLAAV